MKTASQIESEHKWDVVELVTENAALREQLEALKESKNG